MAKDSKRKAAPEVDKDLPEGFQPVTRKRVAGWFLVQKGNHVQGFLKGSFDYDGIFGKKKVYTIQITDGVTEVTTGEGVVEKVSEGALIGIDEKGFLKSLADIEEGREVFILCTGRAEKAAKKGQQPAWTFKIGVVPF